MPSATKTPQIIYRDVEHIAEIRAVENLQIEAWGDDERDIVPLNQLVAARHVGGTLIGAFDDEELIGFVYGFYGHLNGHIVHHSHMLAVNPAYRNHDVGFQLKAAQRQRVLADRITNRMTWTFDPLQSLNAYFNFVKLGVISDTYKINVYGEDATSFLHQNGTDRLFVTWLLDSARVEESISRKRASEQHSADSARDALRLLRNSSFGVPERAANTTEVAAANLLTIAIPADINSLERADFDRAREWREETRRAFSETLASGFVVVDFFRENEQSGIYLLRRTLPEHKPLDKAQ
jgi:predicted GNAT superfamily acetyltransferase